MTHEPRRRSHLLLALLLASACGLAVDPSYEGTPLATLEGQMSVAPDATIDGPVRMALAWYPGLLAEGAAVPLSQPSAIVTEDVVYESSFPVNYRFPLYRPPPAEAMVPLPEGFQGNAALGVLLVYRDDNGNARLDTIPATGKPIDRVLGSSLVWTATTTWLVVYLDSEQRPETGLKRGFNLVRTTNGVTQEPVPLSTRIPLPLSGGPMLDILVCEAGFSDEAVADPCGLGFDNPGGPVGNGLAVSGSVRLSGGRASVELTVQDEQQAVTDAELTLAGHLIPFVPERAAYVLEDLGEPLAEGVPYTLHVTAHGKQLTRELTFPSGFALTAPAPGATVGRDAPLRVQWTATPAASDYNVLLLNGEGVQLGQILTRDVEETFEATGYTGPARVVVEAWFQAPDSETQGLLELKVVREVSITLQ